MQYDAEIMLAFIEEIAEYIPQLRQHLDILAKNPRNKESLEEAHRLAHTIKGSAAMLELDDISAEGKIIEQALAPSADSNSKKKVPFDPSSVGHLQTAVDKVEYLLNKVRAEVTGESLPVAPEPSAPPPAPVVQTPPPVAPVTPNFAAPPPPPAWFASGLGEPAPPLAPPPVPPSPQSNFSFFDDDDLPEFQPNLTPPPPAPPVNFQPVSVPPSSVPSAPTAAKSPEAAFTTSDIFADFDLFGDNDPLAQANPTVPSSPPAPPVAKPTEPLSDTESLQQELDLMDLLLEPNSLESLEHALFPTDAVYAPRGEESKNAAGAILNESGLKLDLGSFDASQPANSLSTPVPEVAPAAGENQRKRSTAGLRSPLDEFELDLVGLDLGELDDILTTQAVDRNISALQDEILRELPTQMSDFDSVPLPGDISISDADLLQALGQDTTNSDLASFHQGNALPRPLGSPELLPKFDDLLTDLPPLPEIETSSDSEAHPLHDFTAAEALLAQFEPEPVAEAHFQLSPVVDENAATLVPNVVLTDEVVAPLDISDLPALPDFTLDAFEVEAVSSLPSVEQALVREGLRETFEMGRAEDALTQAAAFEGLRATPELPPTPAPPAFEFNFPPDMTEEEALAAFEALDAVVPEVPAVEATEEEYSAEELAQAGLVSGDDQLGAFFLAEAQGDIDKLQELVADFDAPDSDKRIIAGKIGKLAETLRKAADMMMLEAVARQAGVLENTAHLVVAGELTQGDRTGNVFHRSLNDLLNLLAPYQEAAARLFAPMPGETVVAESEREEIPVTLPSKVSQEVLVQTPLEPATESAPLSSFEKALAEEAAIAEAVAKLSQGQTESEDFDLEAALAQMQAEAAAGEPSEEEYSAEELAQAGLVSGDDQLGAFFLAEAQGDIDKLQELVADFDALDSDRPYDAKKIAAISETLRKAADMMMLDSVAEQAGKLETLGRAVAAGENQTPGNVFQPELAALLALLAPYQEAAASLFATPAEAAEASDETEAESAEVAASAPELPLEPAVVAHVPTSPPKAPAKATPAPAVSDIDPELAEVFAAEAEEHIQILDTKLAALENDPYNRELLREIRRSAHTLKGSAAMLSFNVISQTAHLMEDLLDRLYDGTAQVTPEVVELLFLTFNGMDSMVRGLSQGVPENPQILADLRPRYAAIMSGEEAEEVATGGAIIFKPRPAAAPAAIRPRTESPATVHEMDEAAITALEAAMAAAEAEAEPSDEPEAATAVAPKVTAPVAAPRASATTTTASGDSEQLSVKIPIKRLDTMMNQIGELVINRTVLERRNQILSRTVDELTLSIKRMQRVTRELETRYEVELLKNSAMPIASDVPLYATSGGETILPANGAATVAMPSATRPEFDTLEMDQYTEFHTLSREMAETVDDLAAALRELGNLKGDLENAILQQARLTDDLQDRVVKVRLVPVSNLTPRLYRTVRSVASLQGKDVQFVVSGEQTQLDKTIFEELGDPLLHLVRNAIDHGIESPEEREAAGKPRQATLTFAARTEGSQVVIEVREDGRGVSLERIKKRALERGLLAPEATPSDEELLDLIFMPGFSTAEAITDISGRGVGLDVVRANIARLKGTVEVSTEVGRGTTFSIRLPSTLAITRALLVKVAGYTYAIPLNSIERTLRTDQKAIEEYGQRSYYRLDETTLPLLELNQLLQVHQHQRRVIDEEEEEGARSRFALKRERPLLLINGPERAVIRVDGLLGQQEVVVKPLGTHLKFVPGVTGATILGSGEVILILNAYELVAGAMGRRRYANLARGQVAPAQPQSRQRATGPLSTPDTRRKTPVIQVVDDSLSIRKVLATALEKAGFRVRTSKDGQEALEMVQQNSPDLIIMDIEMPRMDGYELTSILKSRESFRNIPIVMLTSRAGLKHRQKAEEVGADGFLIKPYREHELLQIVSELLTR